MRLVILFTLLSITSAFAGNSAEVPKALLHEINGKLERLAIIEESQPVVVVSGIEVVQDVQGRIFVKDSAEVSVGFPDANLEFHGGITISAEVSQFRNKRKGVFISRFGLATVAEQSEFQSTKLERNSTYLVYQIFRYKHVGLQALANGRRYGAGLSHRLTPNTSLILGVNYRHQETLKGNSKGFAGVMFNF